MAVQIKNMLKQLVVINLNVNNGIYLAAGETSNAISEKKARSSGEVQRLIKRGAISLETVKRKVKKVKRIRKRRK